MTTYLWQMDIDKIKETSEQESPQLRPFNFGLSLGYGWQNNFNADTFRLPSSISKIGIMMGYRIKPRVYLNSSLTASWQLPDLSGQQSNLFSKIDISAGGKQTINIDLKMHIVVQGTLQANYFLKPGNPRLRPYVGVGIAGLLLVQADTTISQEIDVSTIFSGGGQPNLGGSGDTPDLNLTQLTTISPLIEVGINYKLARSINFLCSIAYQHRFKTEFRGIQANNRLSDISLNFGVQFELSKKVKKYYKYVR
jgi:Outer membrane protein beta-barrel domain